MIRSLSNIFSDKVNIPIQTQDKDNLFLVVVEEGALSAIKDYSCKGCLLIVTQFLWMLILHR